jgi:hypothetical protein
MGAKESLGPAWGGPKDFFEKNDKTAFKESNGLNWE